MDFADCVKSRMFSRDRSALSSSACQMDAREGEPLLIPGCCLGYALFTGESTCPTPNDERSYCGAPLHDQLTADLGTMGCWPRSPISSARSTWRRWMFWVARCDPAGVLRPHPGLRNGRQRARQRAEPRAGTSNAAFVAATTGLDSGLCGGSGHSGADGRLKSLCAQADRLSLQTPWPAVVEEFWSRANGNGRWARCARPRPGAASGPARNGLADCRRPGNTVRACHWTLRPLAGANAEIQ